MKSPYLFLMIWGVTLAASFALYMKPYETESPGVFVATLYGGSGEVVFREPFFSTWRAAKDGQKFQAGTVLSTGKSSRAVIRMLEGQTLSVSANSQVGLGVANGRHRDGMLVSILSGAIAIKNTTRESHSFKRVGAFFEKSLPSSLISSVGMLVAEPARNLEVKSGEVSLVLTDNTKSFAAARTADGLTVVTNVGGVATKNKRAGDSEFSANNDFVMETLDSVDLSSMQSKVGDHSAIESIKKILAVEMTDVAKIELPSDVLSGSVSVKEHLKTKVDSHVVEPESKTPFVAAQWELVGMRSGSFLISTSDLTNKNHEPLEIVLKNISSSGSGGTLPLLLVKRASASGEVLHLSPYRNADKHVFFRPPLEKLSDWSQQTRGTMSLELWVSAPNNGTTSEASRDPGKNRSLGEIQFVSIYDLVDQEFLLTVQNPKAKTHRVSSWITASQIETNDIKNNVKFFFRSKKNLLKWFAGNDLGSGILLEKGSAIRTARSGIVAASSDGFESSFLESQKDERTACERLIAQTQSSFCYHGKIEDYLAKDTLLRKYSANNSSLNSLHMHDGRNLYNLSQAFLANRPGFVSFLRDLPFRFFSRSVRMIRDLESEKKRNLLVTEKSPPNEILSGSLAAHPRLSVIEVVDENFSIPDLDLFGFNDSKFFSLTDSKNVMTNLLVNEISTDSLTGNEDGELALFTKLNQIAEIEILVILRSSSARQLSSKMLARDLAGKIVSRSAHLKDRKELLNWLERQLGYSGIVATESGSWTQVITLLPPPVQGTLGLVFGGSGERKWLPNISSEVKPVAIVVCEKPHLQGCAARVLYKSDLMKSALLNGHVQWVY